MADRRLRMANSSPDVKALFNNSPSYFYHLEEAQESLESQHSYLPPTDYWNPQMPTSRHGRFLSMSHADESLPQATLGPHRGLIDEESTRGSDPLLEPRLGHLSKARSLTNRAQSLDLTYSLSRITEGASRYPPPDSPTHSIGERSSSPSSVTAPSFPSVYGPTGAGRTPIGAHRDVRLLDEESVEEVSRVISNLGL